MEAIHNYFIEDGEKREIREFPEDLTKKGKNIYEVLRIKEGIPIFLENHLSRLENSLKILGLKLWLDVKEVEEKLLELIKVNDIMEGNIKLVFHYDTVKKYYFYFIPHYYPTIEQYDEGVGTRTFCRERKNPNAKVVDVQFKEDMNKIMKEENVFEIILADQNGYVTEGSRSNIFMVRKDKVLTAPLESVLPGVTREMVFRLCEKLKIEVIEEKIKVSELGNMDALFISGTSPKILPISNVGDMIFSSSTNEVVVKIMREYDEKMEEYIAQKRK